MRTSETIQLAGAFTALAAVMTLGGAASAVDRVFSTNPVGICQAALPAFEGQIRKRPLAVQNEGTSNAFVTCAFTSQGSITAVYVYFAAVDGIAHNVSCTGVTGFNTSSNQFVSKTATLPADGGQKFLGWTSVDFATGATTFPNSRFAISCNLLPGVGINDSDLVFSEDVGN